MQAPQLEAEPQEGMRPEPAPRPGTVGRHLPGLGLVAAISVAAWILGGWVPVIGGPVFGIVLGMAVQLALRPGERFDAGFRYAGKQVLQLAVILLGTGLSLAQIVHTGAASLPVMLGTMAAALVGAWVFGRLLGVDGDLRAMIGVGTGICGASAVAAVAGVLEAGELDVAYAISTIFLFNVVAVLLYPAIGHAIGFGQHAFGLWAGTAINDTSSVVAAAYTYGRVAGNYAVVVKLTRTTLILPIALALAVQRLRHNRRAADGQRLRIRWRTLVPWFIVLFLVAAVANTLGVFSPAVEHLLGRVALFLIVMALTGIGLSARFGAMKRTGVKPLLLGAALWATVGASSIALQGLMGR